MSTLTNTPVRRAALASLAVVGFAIAGIAAPAAATAPAVVGHLVDTTGAPLPGEVVSASVETMSAEELAAAPVGTISYSTEVGSATTDRAGNFRVRIENLAAVEEAVDDTNLVSILFTSAPSAGGQAYYRVRMELRDNGRLVAYAPDIASDTDPGWIADLRAEGRSNTQSVLVGQAQGVPQLKLVAGAAGEPATTGGIGIQSVDYARYCGTTQWGWRRTDNLVNKEVFLARTYSMNRTTVSWGWDSTATTSIEYGVQRQSDYAFMASAGFSRGSSMGVNIDGAGTVNQNLAWWVGYRFRAYDIMCLETNPTLREVYSGYREWRPEAHNGAAGSRAWTVFACNPANRSPLDGSITGVQISANKTATSRWAFTIGTSGLRAQQTWDNTQTSGERVRYNRFGAGAWALCGETGTYPTAQSRTREVP